MANKKLFSLNEVYGKGKVTFKGPVALAGKVLQINFVLFIAVKNFERNRNTKIIRIEIVPYFVRKKMEIIFLL